MPSEQVAALKLPESSPHLRRGKAAVSSERTDGDAERAVDGAIAEAEDVEDEGAAKGQLRENSWTFDAHGV